MEGCFTPESPSIGIESMQSCLVDGILQPKTRQLLGDIVTLGRGTTIDHLAAMLRGERVRGIGVLNVDPDHGSIDEHQISCAYDVWLALKASPHTAQLIANTSCLTC